MFAIIYLLGVFLEDEIELGKQLIRELVDLWTECKMRCDEIEELIKKISEFEK